MAKGVLGNDPFLRGAPAREGTEAQSAPAPAKPVAPEPKPAAEPKKAAKAPAARQWPTAETRNKPARASVRKLMSERAPVLEQPPERLNQWEPTAHPGAPELVALLHARMREFFPHPNAPELKAVLGEIGTPHSHSPSAVLSCTTPVRSVSFFS